MLRHLRNEIHRIGYAEDARGKNGGSQLTYAARSASLLSRRYLREYSRYHHGKDIEGCSCKGTRDWNTQKTGIAKLFNCWYLRPSFSFSPPLLRSLLSLPCSLQLAIRRRPRLLRVLLCGDQLLLRTHHRKYTRTFSLHPLLPPSFL